MSAGVGPQQGPTYPGGSPCSRWICAARSRTSRLGLAMIGLPDLTGRIAVRMTHRGTADPVADIRVRREHVLGVVRGQLVHAGRDTLPLVGPDRGLDDGDPGPQLLVYGCRNDASELLKRRTADGLVAAAVDEQ